MTGRVISAKLILMLSAVDIERRLPVWLAMSELFLDTELDPVDFARIRTALGASDYDSADLSGIFLQEVVPVLGHNLLSVVGEWAGWDADDLRRLLLPRLQRKRRARLGNWLFCIAFGRDFFYP
jgi:hypothetical protein